MQAVRVIRFCVDTIPVSFSVRNGNEASLNPYSPAAMQTAEDRAKLSGPGLLVCDSQPEETSEQHFYVVEAEGKLHIVDGKQAKQAASVCAQVLFLCRPPSAVGSIASQTSQLLSV